MADIDQKDRASTSRIVGADSDGTENEFATVETIDAKRRLLVDAGLSQGGSISLQLSSKMRHIFDDTGWTLSASYTTIYTYSGSGLLVGFGMHHQSGNTIYKLTIDSDVIFELDTSDVGLMTHSASWNWPLPAPITNPTGKQFFYYPKYPIPYSTLVKVEAKLATGSSDVYRYMISLTQET